MNGSKKHPQQPPTTAPETDWPPCVWVVMASTRRPANRPPTAPSPTTAARPRAAFLLLGRRSASSMGPLTITAQKNPPRMPKSIQASSNKTVMAPPFRLQAADNGRSLAERRNIVQMRSEGLARNPDLLLWRPAEGEHRQGGILSATITLERHPYALIGTTCPDEC